MLWTNCVVLVWHMVSKETSPIRNFLELLVLSFELIMKRVSAMWHILCISRSMHLKVETPEDYRREDSLKMGREWQSRDPGLRMEAEEKSMIDVEEVHTTMRISLVVPILFVTGLSCNILLVSYKVLFQRHVQSKG